jgi:hypothetical protein
VADRIGVGSGFFQVDAGNNSWGSWIQILGLNDTPVDDGMMYYDIHRITILEAERISAPHFLQIGFGESGAESLSNNTYTEFVYEPPTASVEEFPIDVQSRRISVNTKAWFRIFVPGQNTGTLDFCFGIHEYEG